MISNMYEIIQERDQYKEERDSLIDDIAVLKANISRLEREKKEREKRAEEAMTLAEEANCQVVSLQELLEINEKLKRENRRKHYSANENNKYYKELWKRTEEYRKEVAEITEKYTILTDHIRLKEENNPGVSRYIDLVNYIDRLEREYDER